MNTNFEIGDKVVCYKLINDYGYINPTFGKVYTVKYIEKNILSDFIELSPEEWNYINFLTAQFVKKDKCSKLFKKLYNI